MPSPRAPSASHQLEEFTSLPASATSLQVTVALVAHNSRVKVRAEVTRGRAVELWGTLTCGVKLWRSCVGPAITRLCEARGLPCDVREVEYQGAS